MGYKLDSAMDVLNAIKQSSAKNCNNHTIYLIAEKVYRPPEFSIPSWYANWVDEIKRSLRSNEPTYVRSRKYDKLLSLLFPELASGLNKTLKAKTPSPVDSEPALMDILAIQARNDAYWAAYRPKSHTQARNNPTLWRLGIDVEEVLKDAETVRAGSESMRDWFGRWNTRYRLHKNLNSIVELLVSMGFTEAESEFRKWLQSLPPKNDMRPYGQSQQERQAVNKYAEIKGRSGPRK